MRKKYIPIFAALICLCLLSGCKIKSKTDISMRETVTVVGIDEKDDKITLTITLELVQPTEGDSSASKVAIYTAEGDSVFEAIQKFHPYTNKIIFWGHVGYLIIGEETAKLGVNKYLDLFARDHEIKQNSKIIIAKGSTAEDLIKDTNLPDTPLTETLQSLFTDNKNLANDNQVSILQYLQMVSCRKMCLYLPAIKTTDNKEKTEEEEGKKDVMLDGYALFFEDVLTTFMACDLARGANWIMDESYAGYITVKDDNDDLVVMEVTQNKPSYKIDYSGEYPDVEITIEAHTNIVEYHGSEDIFKNGKIDEIVEKQNKFVENQVMEAVKFLQENKKDIIGVSNELFHRYPQRTYYYDDEWADIFSKANIRVKAETSIDRTYNINQPVAYEEGDEN